MLMYLRVKNTNGCQTLNTLKIMELILGTYDGRDMFSIKTKHFDLNKC
jgi:hypothetical protein